MSKTLVSFLGRVQRDKATGRYKTAKYCFADNTIIETPFFGLALVERLNPDLLVLLGTRGSMWDVLIEHLNPEHDLNDALIKAADGGCADAELVSRLEPILTEALGTHCVIKLIDYGRDATEQMAILGAIAESVPPGSVTLDLTHGFRHLAALGMLSGFFLERVSHLTVDGLYYGALEMTEGGITPVIRLDGLLAVQRWIDALDRFDQSGDFSVFAALLIADGVSADKARCLEDAAFHERNFNLSDARRAIQTFLPALDGDLAGASGMFRDALAKRLSWARDGELMDHQRRLANFYLDNRDYVRAALLAYEAVITRECKQRGLEPLNYRQGREPATSELEAEINAGQYPDRIRESYTMLKNLRNTLAHGNRASNEYVRGIVTNRNKLPLELRKAMDRLLS